MRYNDINAYHEANDSEFEYNDDEREMKRKPKRIRTSPRFHFYHQINNWDMNTYQIFSLEQLNNKDRLNNNDLLRYHCFISCLKYFIIYSKTIEFEKEIIKDILPIKHLNNISNPIDITSSVTHVDEAAKTHYHKQNGLKGICNNKLILMFEPY
jgi:hypothetical protein